MTKAKALYDAQYRATHKDAIARYRAQHYAAHKEAAARYRAAHKEAAAQYQAHYRATHKESAAQYRATHKEAIAQCRARYRAAHKEAAAQYQATRRKNDVNFRICCALRKRLSAALRGRSKSARTLNLLGCSIEFLRVHLEKQFVPGMTWENYGPVWHIDHILPCAAFHLQHSEEQEICFHWTNYQPLFAEDNFSKGDKITP